MVKPAKSTQHWQADRANIFCMDCISLSPRLGFEVELVAPSGSSRRDLAERFARSFGGSIRPVWHRDTEPSLVPGRPVFHHLTIGFEVLDRNSHPVCRIIDDITIVNDLNNAAPPTPGWFRVIGDDARLLLLAARHCSPDQPASIALRPLADLFGVAVTTKPSGRFAVEDTTGASVAMTTPETGQRERVCEVVTPPWTDHHIERLEALLQPARELDFAIPAEAAVHVHLDAEPFRQPLAFQALVTPFVNKRDQLWRDLATNQRCRRLGPLPPAVLAVADQACDETWTPAQLRDGLAKLALTKHCDLNLTRLAGRWAPQDTVEIRLLPGADTASTIARGLQTLRDHLPIER